MDWVMRRILVSLILAIAGAGGGWIVDASPATTESADSGQSSQTGVMSKVAAPPTELGCYHYAPDSGWRKVQCDTKEYIEQHIPHPEVALLGVADNKGTVPFTASTVRVNLWNLGPETDINPRTGSPAAGSKSYSIQVNVFFTGNNGDPDSVQFTNQVQPDGSGTANNICVWNVDIKTQNYDATCDTIFTPFGIHQVKGFTFGNGNVETVVNIGGGTFEAVVATDEYQLESGNRWNNASGTILGYGNGSEAVFSGTGGEATTTLEATTCLEEDPLDIIIAPIRCTGAEEIKSKANVIVSPGPSTNGGKTLETNSLAPVTGNPSLNPALILLCRQPDDAQRLERASTGILLAKFTRAKD